MLGQMVIIEPLVPQFNFLKPIWRKKITNKQSREDVPICGKSLVLPTIMTIGIVSAIDNGAGVHA